MRLAKMAELRGAFVYAAALGCLLISGVGCKDDDEADHDDMDDEHGEHAEEVVGPMTGATCPANSTLTYDNFGKEFFTKYCTRCHSEKVTGTARNGAPADHNFDTKADIALLWAHIDEMAGSGPDATNETMPKSDPKPTKEERQKLSEWLACDAP